MQKRKVSATVSEGDRLECYCSNLLFYVFTHFRSCVAFQKTADGWSTCCQQFLFRSKFPDEVLSSSLSIADVNDWLIELRFWYIQVITQRVPSLTLNERSTVRRFLFMYLEDLLPWRAATLMAFSLQTQQVQVPTDSTVPFQSPFFIATADNPAVLAKLALLYVRCLVADYPETWPTGITSLLELWTQRRNAYFQSHSLSSSSPSSISGASSPSGIGASSFQPSRPLLSQIQLTELITLKQKFLTMTHFFLSVMEALDDEVVMETVERSQKEKNRNTEVTTGKYI